MYNLNLFKTMMNDLFYKTCSFFKSFNKIKTLLKRHKIKLALVNNQ